MERLLKNSKGQGMTEYIIIVALIAIAAIGVVTLFGQNIRALFAGASNSLAGDTNVTAKTKKAKSKHTKMKKINKVGTDNKSD